MSWKTDSTPEFDGWVEDLAGSEQEDVEAAVELLEELGPSAKRPLVDTVNDSKHSNMKELRVTQTIRAFFAFDPTRTGILLIGGDKAGQKQRRWYKRMIAKADRLYDRHLARLRKHPK